MDLQLRRPGPDLYRRQRPTTSYTYNSLGRLTDIKEPGTGSPTIEYGYDSAGDVTSVTDEVGDTSHILTTRWVASSPSKTRCRPPPARTPSFTYDDDGNLLTATDANGHTTTYTYNARNEEVSMTDAMDRITSYGYDADGNLITVTDPLDQYNDIFVYADNKCSPSPIRLDGTTTYGYDLDDEVTR